MCFTPHLRMSAEIVLLLLPLYEAYDTRRYRLNGTIWIGLLILSQMIKRARINSHHR